MTTSNGPGTTLALSIHTGPAGITLADDEAGTCRGALDLTIAHVQNDGATTTDVDTTIRLTLPSDTHDAIRGSA